MCQMHLGQPYLSPDKQRRISNFTVTSVDFVHKHPRLVVAAGRHPVPWLVDLRDRNWHAFGGTSMVETHDASIRINGKAWDQDNVVTHVRSAGQYHVVAASLNNKMLMYDLRYMKSPKSSREEDVVAAALFRFRNYHKSSRLTGLGFDVDAELGLVAAAEEHEYYTGLGGGLSLFSLATGERIHAPGLWHVSHSPERLAHIYKPPKGLLTLPRTSTAAGWNGDLAGLLSEMPAPGLFITVASERDRTLFKSLGENVDKQPLPRVGALSFTALPHENTSLFAAVGARVHKFSLKHDRKDMFYGEDEEDMVDEQAHRP
ncbi:plasma membrane H+-ATPase [Sporothrix bragantina]|uniref:Plasma membrane H+-ATPase n=1 Tax=Sporothrix bragantina TaxID=671064 RepID=A0ABP0BBY8_9PEZI